jgi:hypothetical protein
VGDRTPRAGRERGLAAGQAAARTALTAAASSAQRARGAC